MGTPLGWVNCSIGRSYRSRKYASEALLSHRHADLRGRIREGLGWEGPPERSWTPPTPLSPPEGH
eukprot:1159036-Pelagomonas_calceolata.AAC.14